jgi:transposase
MWARLEPLLPDRGPHRGGRWRQHREVVEAIIWRFRTGSPWRDLPGELPPWQTVWYRFDRWSKDGTWDAVLHELQGQAQAVGELEWTVSVDSTIARAHQHAAGARRDLTGGGVESQDSLA